MFQVAIENMGFQRQEGRALMRAGAPRCKPWRGGCGNHMPGRAHCRGREGSLMFERCTWLNEPARWSVFDDRLDVVTDARTDFWRQTHYGFTRDTGHFFGADTGGDFTAELRIRAAYEALYDQAGLMVRVDAENWVKAGIELSDGVPMLGSVLTRKSSDWATGRFEGDAADFWLRVTVAGGVLRLQASADGKHWPLLRLAPFPAAARYRVGPMCCTPERAGLSVSFTDFSIGPPTMRALHDLG
jgi:regulation of enolase protein 1 (concanavalin A-like superfamily)